MRVVREVLQHPERRQELQAVRPEPAERVVLLLERRHHVVPVRAQSTVAAEDADAIAAGDARHRDRLLRRLEGEETHPPEEALVT